MSKKIIILSSILTFFIACKSNSQDNSTATVQVQKKGIQHLNALDFKDAIQFPGVNLIDIRTKAEYEQGHIAHAIWIDWYKKTFQKYVQLLPKDKPVLLYCRSGNRSGKASHVLQSLGFQKIINLRYGIHDWNAHKLPLSREDSAENKAFQKKKISHTNANTSTGNGKIYHVSAADFKKVIDLKKVNLVDIRTQAEFLSGHLKGALHIDWYKRDFKQQIQRLSKDKPIAIYCRSGNRSGKATHLLQDIGFKQIINLARGINDWNQNGFPLEK